MYQVQIQLDDDNKGRRQYEVIENVTRAEADRFVKAWKDSGYNKPGGMDKITVNSVTGGSYTASPLSIHAIMVEPMDFVYKMPDPHTAERWEFKFTYPGSKRESVWCDVHEQVIDWSGMERSPIIAVSFRKARD